MPNWVRSRVLRFLFHITDGADGAEGDDTKVEDWLADNWGHPGFRAYIAQRDLTLVKHIAGGDLLIAPEPKKAWQLSGQRFEALILGQKAKAAFSKRVREKGK